MEGLVTSYSGTSLVINVDNTSGGGTHADWNIDLAGDVGATGATGATGAQGPQGPTGPTVPLVHKDPRDRLARPVRRGR